MQPGVKTLWKIDYRGSDLKLTDGDVRVESALGACIGRDHPQCNSPEHALVSDRTRTYTYGLTPNPKYASRVFVRVLQPTRGGRVEMSSDDMIGD